MATPHAATGLFGRAAEQLRQFICGLHGHDALLHFEQGRMSLQCTSCGYETPGWNIQEHPEGIPADGKPRMVRMPLVRHRRAA